MPRIPRWQDREYQSHDTTMLELAISQTTFFNTDKELSAIHLAVDGILHAECIVPPRQLGISSIEVMKELMEVVNDYGQP